MFTLYRIFKGLDITPEDFFQSCYGKRKHVLTGNEKVILAKWEKLSDIKKNMVLGYINGMMADEELIK